MPSARTTPSSIQPLLINAAFDSHADDPAFGHAQVSALTVRISLVTLTLAANGGGYAS